MGEREGLALTMGQVAGILQPFLTLGEGEGFALTLGQVAGILPPFPTLGEREGLALTLGLAVFCGLLEGDLVAGHIPRHSHPGYMGIL